MSNSTKVSVSSILASTALVAFMAGNAVAADLPPIVEVPPEVATPSYGGWYLRGDIGYAKSKIEGVSYFQGATQSGAFEQYDIDHTWMFGGGLGYQVTDWFRVDLTADYYAKADFTGSSAQNVACSDGTVGAICSYSDNSDVQVTTLLANAYADLGTWGGFTPYVGAGIGGALVHWGDLRNSEYSVSGPTPGTLAIDTHGKRSGWRFAYGLHAGASYDLTSRLKLDAGYSFTHINGGTMFGFGATSSLDGNQGYDGDMKIHAFKVGLRYAIN